MCHKAVESENAGFWHRPEYCYLLTHTQVHMDARGFELLASALQGQRSTVELSARNANKYKSALFKGSSYADTVCP